MLSPGHTVLDDYEVESLLGEGATGAVWRVRDRLTGEALALKMARRPGADARRQLVAELRVWGALPAHPHVVGLRFFRSIDDGVVLFLDLVDGPSLDARIRQGPRLDDATRVDIAIQMALGLQGAHAFGVVHQDVKPANVLVGSDGVARVSDFGVAAALRRGVSADEPTVTVAGMSRAWSSPEQQRGERVGPASDQWSWAASVLQLFVGDRTWDDGRDAPLALALHARRAKGALGPRAVLDVLRRCFREAPEARFASMHEIVLRLAEVYRELRGEPYPRGISWTMPNAQDGGTARGPRFDPAFWASRLARYGGGPAPDIAPRRIDGTARDQALDDLRAFDALREAFERCVAAGHVAATEDLAALAWAQACLHRAFGDLPGAASCLARANDLFERRKGAGHADRDLLALQARLDDVALRAEQGEAAGATRRAEALVVEAGLILLRDLDPDARAAIERMRDLARIHHAAALVTRGDGAGALARLAPVFARIEDATLERDAPRVIQWFARALPGALGLRPGAVAGDLALAWHNRGAAATLVGALDEADRSLRRSLALYASLPATPAWIRQRVRCLTCAVDVALARGDTDVARAHLAPVCDWIEATRVGDAHDDLVAELAGALALRSVVELAAGDLGASRASWRLAVETFERVVRGGRHEAALGFARSALRLAHALAHRGHHDDSAAACDRPIALLEKATRTHEETSALAALLTQRATSRSNSEDVPSRRAALDDFDAALALDAALPERDTLVERLACGVNRAWLALELDPTPETATAAASALGALRDAFGRTRDPGLGRILAATETELTSLLARHEVAYPSAR